MTDEEQEKIKAALEKLPKANRSIIWTLLVEADSYEDEVNIVLELIDQAYEKGREEMRSQMLERRE